MNIDKIQKQFHFMVTTLDDSFSLLALSPLRNVIIKNVEVLLRGEHVYSYKEDNLIERLYRADEYKSLDFIELLCIRMEHLLEAKHLNMEIKQYLYIHNIKIIDGVESTQKAFYVIMNTLINDCFYEIADNWDTKLTY